MQVEAGYRQGIHCFCVSFCMLQTLATDLKRAEPSHGAIEARITKHYATDADFNKPFFRLANLKDSSPL
jgi:hypothetical protein